MVKSGKVEFIGTSENFYNVNPPPLPQGWKISIDYGTESKIAAVTVYKKEKVASIVLDSGIFKDPNIPEGCKVFMIFHELGHLIYGPAENKCDEFALLHSLRAGVSPFLCYLAIRAYMPSHYNYRIVELGNKILSNNQWRNDIS